MECCFSSFFMFEPFGSEDLIGENYFCTYLHYTSLERQIARLTRLDQTLTALVLQLFTA